MSKTTGAIGLLMLCLAGYWTLAKPRRDSGETPQMDSPPYSIL